MSRILFATAMALGCIGCNGQQAEVVSKMPSANYLLGIGEIEKFKPGESREDILKAVHSRGNLLMSGQHEGKNLTAITYGFFGGVHSSEGEALAAILVDNKFVKFVEWPVLDRTLKIGDFSTLAKAAESKAVTIADLQNRKNVHGKAPKDIDPGLTVAWLLLQPSFQAGQANRESEFVENAKLREQFNAAKVNLGMSEAEVEAIFTTKPLAKVKIEGGEIRVYGSTVSFDLLLPDLHYSNVLIVYVNEKVSGIYAIPGGPDWKHQLLDWFANAPRNWQAPQ